MAWPDWQSIERASWVVTILALIIGLFQITLVLRELRKKAKIKMGLIVPDKARRPENLTAERTIAAPWSVGSWQSRRIKIAFGIANSGKRTAEDLYHELVFPSTIFTVHAAEGEGDAYRDASGQVHIVWGPDNLHPRSGLTHYVFLYVPQEITDASVLSKAVFRDSSLLESNLNLEFQARM